MGARSAYYKAWCERNAEHLREYGRKYRETHREEHNANARLHYAEHRDQKAKWMKAYRQENKERDLERQRRLRSWYRENLRILRVAQGCEDCGKRSGWLEHHHIDPQTRVWSIADMAPHSLESWMDEIAKCTVLCRPCHKKRHFAMKRAVA